MNRIKEQPILGKIEKGPLVTFTFDGKRMEGHAGEPIASALMAAGVMVRRYTQRRHQPRDIFCAIGSCTDCPISAPVSRSWRREWWSRPRTG